MWVFFVDVCCASSEQIGWKDTNRKFCSQDKQLLAPKASEVHKSQKKKFLSVSDLVNIQHSTSAKGNALGAVFTDVIKFCVCVKRTELAICL